MKEEFMVEVFRILAITLGLPPKPDEPFKWEYYDTDGKFHCFNGTPQEFYLKNRNSKYPLTDSFSLVNDPRNKYEALYTVDKLGNVWGGRPVTCKVLNSRWTFLHPFFRRQHYNHQTKGSGGYRE